MHREWVIRRTYRHIVLTLSCFAALLLGQALVAGAQEGEGAVEKPGKIGRMEDIIDKKLDERLIGVRDFRIYGYVDLSYTQNFRSPNPSDRQVGGVGGNQLRIFDVDSNSFRTHLAQIVLEKPAKFGGTMEDRAGFRIKLNFGSDAQFTGGGERFGDGDDTDFQEVYAQFIAPIGNGLDIRFGRMNTLIGYEVIESPYNPNFTRSWLFGLGQPFTTTGVRLAYNFTDQVSWALGAINAFNGAESDTNNSKSVETALSMTLTDQVGLTLYGFWGPEGGLGKEDTDLLQGGGILDIQATEQAEVVVEGYYANLANAGPSLGLDPGENQSWYGVAGYLIYDFTEQWGARIRGEWWRDNNGGFTGINQSMWETTYTVQYKPVPSLITRLEYRRDESTKEAFLDGSSPTDKQDTLAFEAIYLF